MSGSAFPQYQTNTLVKDLLTQLGILVRLEQKLLWLIASFAVVIGLFMLCVPIAVQELVSKFSYGVQPIMVFTLALVVGCSLTGAAVFRVIQGRATETLQTRIYTRIAIAFTTTLPRLHEESFLPQHVHRFAEAEMLSRALVALIADLFNVAVVGTIGMTMLVYFHPYFLIYNLALMSGFIILLTIFGQGAFLSSLERSRANYEIYDWMQDMAVNLPHLRAAGSSPYLLHKTDALTKAYVLARKWRVDVLVGRQYKAGVLWLVAGHTGMIGTAGMLVADSQLTVGQFAAAELVVGQLLMNMDTLARRITHMFFAFVAFRELNSFFSLPQDQPGDKMIVPVSPFGLNGVQVTARNLSFAHPGAAPIFKKLNLDVVAGEKVVLLCHSNVQKTAVVKVLAGLLPPTDGFVRYNDFNLVELAQQSIAAYRGLMLDSHPTLLRGTIEDNLTLGRPSISHDDLQWALHFVELDEEIDRLPDGLATVITGQRDQFTLSQTLRLLLARAIVTKPTLLIIDGTLHNMIPTLRETILRRLCSKDEPRSVIFATNDVPFSFAERHIVL